MIFAVAAVVAVVRATGSDDAAASDSAEATVVAPSEREAGQGASDSNEPDDTAAAQAEALAQEQQQAPEQEADSASDVVETAEAEQDEQAQSVDQQADQQQAILAQPAPEADNPLRGFDIPIAGACITEFEGHLPSSSRAYRNDGVHEGLDFYQWASCTTVGYGTEVLAAKAGVVIRADLDYVEVTPSEWARFEEANFEGEQILDRLRGRQVYIDHGRGIVSRYAHLSDIAEGIAIGVQVQQGQLIGYPGESGQREVYENPGTDIHLHFEIRIGAGWLGQGGTPQAARTLYLQAFDLVD